MQATQEQRVPGLVIDYKEWEGELVHGIYVELMDVTEGKADISQIYIKPGTVLELDGLEFLESKIAL